MNKNLPLFLIICLFLLAGNAIRAQGDGPRSYLPVPIGVWGVVPKYLHLNQNIVPAGNILIQDADITVDVFPTTFFHTFGIKGRPAVVQFMINPGSATAKFNVLNAPFDHIDANGFSDGFVAFKMSLVGIRALNVIEFPQHPMVFNLSGNLRVWYSGSYDREKIFNLGTNRFAVELGTPMVIPLNDNPKRATWLETYPCIQFFTDNNDPVRPAGKTEQKPLFILENHLTHNFTPKFWGGIDLRFQYGGRTKVDGVEDDNRINILGGGISAGCQFLPFLGANTTYGGIMFGDNNARSEMFRFALIFTYADVRKLQQK